MDKNVTKKLIESHLVEGRMTASEEIGLKIDQTLTQAPAWKLLGRALVESGRPADALVAYREGIAAAEAKGDKQAAKEMTVYARRIEKSVEEDRNRSHENG